MCPSENAVVKLSPHAVPEMGGGDNPDCTITRAYPVAVEITPENLRALDTRLRAFAARVRYSAELSDGSTLRFTDVDKAVGFSNGRSRAIRELRASADGGGSATLTITEQTDYRKPVSLTATGPDPRVAQLASSVDAWVADARQGWGYGVIARQHFLSLLMLFGALQYGALYIGLAIARALAGDLSIARAEPEVQLTALGWLVSFGFWSVPAVLAWLANKMRRQLWPPATFLIGDGVRRSERLGHRRTVLTFSLAVPLLLAVPGYWALL